MSSYSSTLDFYLDISSKRLSLVQELCIAFCGALLIALSARIYIPLGFTPVPITLQTYAVLTLATLLGSRRAPLSVLMYLFLGALGAPVLSKGQSGYEVLFGATGGYLLGFLVASFFVGKLIERGWDRSFLKGLFTFALGQVLVFIPGLLVLSFFVGTESVLEKGLYPFMIGGGVKALLGVTTSLGIWKIVDLVREKQNV